MKYTMLSSHIKANDYSSVSHRFNGNVGYKMKTGVHLFLILLVSTETFFITSAYGQDKQMIMKVGCRMSQSFTIQSCDGDMSVSALNQSQYMAYGTTCYLKSEDTQINVTCMHPNQSLSDHPHTVKRRQIFTGLGATIGSAFGPLGTVIGAGVGLAVDFCLILCHKDQAEQPNQPPEIWRQPILHTKSLITADRGEKTATVAWELPLIHDNEDGTNLNVETHPDFFKSGDKFEEGVFTIHFFAKDSAGLTAYADLTFEVRVQRCPMPEWPDNGDLRCSTEDIIYGTECNIHCDPGYTVPQDQDRITCNSNGHWSRRTKGCSAKPCVGKPSVSHGWVECPGNQWIYGSVCEVVCEDGYVVAGASTVLCSANGDWPDVPKCIDIRPPAFINGECPDNILETSISADHTAKVIWDIPYGEDNSKDPVKIAEVHGYEPGQIFKAGQYQIKYTIEDSSQNRGDSCTFLISINVAYCTPPDLQVFGSESLLYSHPTSYAVGSTCYLSCSGGYQFQGADQIQCLPDENNVVSWKWDPSALAPQCQNSYCPKLRTPLHGAVACSEWSHGQMCQMQCHNGYDVLQPNVGQFVCTYGGGTWNPSDAVPDCNEEMKATQMNLHSQFYYYTNECNSSKQNLLEIQQNFVEALNRSDYNIVCVGKEECQARFVSISCGPTTSGRRRREIPVVRRSVTELAYRIKFEIVVPFTILPDQSPDDVFAINDQVLNSIADRIQSEVVNGQFDIPDLTTTANSFVRGYVQYKCDAGMLPRHETASCVGCPVGQYLADGAVQCQQCPYGFYQDMPNSEDCIQCPPNTNTTNVGASNVSACLEFCEPGHYSSTGLAPCAVCPRDSYQSAAMATTCNNCPKGKKTISDGGQSEDDCKVFDARVKDSAELVLTNISGTPAFTISTWVRFGFNTSSVPAFQIRGHSGAFTLALELGSFINLTMNSINKQVTNYTLNKGSWVHICLAADKNKVDLYINGTRYLSSNISGPTRTNLIDADDTFYIKGDMVLSAFVVLGRKANTNEVSVWASNCSVVVESYLVSLDDIVRTDGATTVIPSVCDAVDECRISPCGRHKCQNNLDGYACVCLDGYSGRNCDTPPDLCAVNSCQNGATCVNGQSNYTCTCPYGYSGYFCEKQATDGTWSPWRPWSTCSESCGGGVQLRRRSCDSPPPDPEGRPCLGDDTEVRKCSDEKCPECLPLRSSPGIAISCKLSDAGQSCTISCKPGLFFATTPLPFYECGIATGYKWNHQNGDNPTGKLPACSELQLPSQLGVNFYGNYDTLLCTNTNQEKVNEALNAKLDTIDCVRTSTCTATVKFNDCGSSRRKRAIGGEMIMRVSIKANVTSSPDDIHVDDVMQNKTSPSQDLVDFVNLTMQLEKSAQKLANGSADFFEVTVDGRNHTIASSGNGLTYDSALKCPNGSVRMDVFCAKSPAGTYSDGVTVTMCPIGQYQDESGQSSCKACPPGTSTSGIGSMSSDECSDEANANEPYQTIEINKDNLKLVIGVSLSIAVVVSGVKLALKV